MGGLKASPARRAADLGEGRRRAGVRAAAGGQLRGSVCITPNALPSGSQQYASRPTPGISVGLIRTSPPAASTTDTVPSRSGTVIVTVVPGNDVSPRRVIPPSIPSPSPVEISQYSAPSSEPSQRENDQPSACS